MLDVHRRYDRLRPKRSRLLRLCIDIVHSKINSPVRWNRSHLRLDLHHATSVRVADHEFRVSHRSAVRVVFPAKQFGVKVAGSRRIVGQEFIPG